MQLTEQPRLSGVWKAAMLVGLLIAFGVGVIAVNQLIQPDPEFIKLRNCESKIDSGDALTATEQKEYCRLLEKIRMIFLDNCEKLNLQNGRIISQYSNKSRCIKRDYLFADRNKALNWARLELGHNTKKTYTTNGQLNGWENDKGDTV